MIKNISILGLLFSTLFTLSTTAQILSVGSQSNLTIIAGTDFTIDELVITPSKNISIINNAISISKKSFIENFETIQKTYAFQNPIDLFCGKFIVRYNENDLNGLDENNFKLHMNNNYSWQIIDLKSINTFKNTIESSNLYNKGVKEITLGSEKGKHEFEIIQNPLVNKILNVNVYKPQYLSVFSLDGKIIFRRFFPSGLNQCDMNKFPQSLYILSSPTKSLKFTL
jgi:hypothetical protein